MIRTVTPKQATLIPNDAERVFKGIIFDVYHWQQTMFDGSKATFEMLWRPDTVKVLVVKDGKIVVLDEEQPGMRRAYELPGGRHDVATETELDCAKRELLEETGIVCSEYRLIDVYQPQHKVEAFVYLFLATGVTSQTAPQVDNGEKIDVQLMSFDDCLAHSKTPKGKYLPRGILEEAGSIEGLLTLPTYEGGPGMTR